MWFSGGNGSDADEDFKTCRSDSSSSDDEEEEMNAVKGAAEDEELARKKKQERDVTLQKLKAAQAEANYTEMKRRVDQCLKLKQERDAKRTMEDRKQSIIEVRTCPSQSVQCCEAVMRSSIARNGWTVPRERWPPCLRPSVVLFLCSQPLRRCGGGGARVDGRVRVRVGRIG